jgi:AraC-like DNA-binding protein
LQDIAKELGVTPNTLSHLINDYLGKSFSIYLNEFRIEEAKKILVTNEQFTIEAIGYEAGFNSKSSFFATFKKFTKTTPAAYKKAHFPTK